VYRERTTEVPTWIHLSNQKINQRAHGNIGNKNRNFYCQVVQPTDLPYEPQPIHKSGCVFGPSLVCVKPGKTERRKSACPTKPTTHIKTKTGQKTKAENGLKKQTAPKK